MARQRRATQESKSTNTNDAATTREDAQEFKWRDGVFQMACTYAMLSPRSIFVTSRPGNIAEADSFDQPGIES
jgi:hypothetical protein